MNIFMFGVGVTLICLGCSIIAALGGYRTVSILCFAVGGWAFIAGMVGELLTVRKP